VLLVEDDDILAHAVSFALERNQHQVWLATDLQSGVALLEREPMDLAP